MSATQRKESSPVRPAARAEGLPHRLPVVRHPHVGKPRALNSLLEPRALLEMALLPASLPLLLQGAARRRPSGAAAARLHGRRKSLIALKALPAAQGL
jgi:hypothetical protein